MSIFSIYPSSSMQCLHMHFKTFNLIFNFFVVFGPYYCSVAEWQVIDPFLIASFPDSHTPKFHHLQYQTMKADGLRIWEWSLGTRLSLPLCGTSDTNAEVCISPQRMMITSWMPRQSGSDLWTQPSKHQC